MPTNLPDIRYLERLARLTRYYILRSTTNAGSGHPTSSFSATDLMVGLFFDTLRFDLARPEHPNNDRVIFSKGHASPLLYALYGAAGVVSEEELDGLRTMGNPLEGHPTPKFKYAEASTGSLGQGLSIGFGMALNGKYLDKLPYRTYVLLGDSEMAEGSVWEAIQLAAHYRLGNLIGIVDINRLGQTQETMLGHDVDAYRARIEPFGWHVIEIDGHDLEQIVGAVRSLGELDDEKPVMILAKTIKGKGVSFLEDKNGWHGKALSPEEYEKALVELGEVDRNARGAIRRPEELQPARPDATAKAEPISYQRGEKVATRKAYGDALKRLGAALPEIVSLDGEVKNSTYAQTFKDAFPERFFEMFIAEQNMVGAALGLSKRGKVPFASTFAAFWTRAHDQIRMAAYSESNAKFVGSHSGVSIGEDGPSQMGLEDLAMFAGLAESTVLYPADAVATEKLVEEAARHEGLVYIRTTRPATEVIYGVEEAFPIGGSKTLRSSADDVATVVSAGITLYEALAAADELAAEGLPVRVIDAYSIKPIDEQGLRAAAAETNGVVITIEDHWAEGGLGDAVLSALGDADARVHKLAVTKTPMSATPEQLLDFEGISRRAIVEKVRNVARAKQVSGVS